MFPVTLPNPPNEPKYIYRNTKIYCTQVSKIHSEVSKKTNKHPRHSKKQPLPIMKRKISQVNSAQFISWTSKLVTSILQITLLRNRKQGTDYQKHLQYIYLIKGFYLEYIKTVKTQWWHKQKWAKYLNLSLPE